MKPDPDRISAPADFSVLTYQTGVRLFLGLCNQLTFFVPDYQHHTVVLRQLTGKGRPFLLLPEHQHEFDTLKKIRHFDPSKNIILLTNASRLHGLGYALGHIDVDSTGSKHFKIVHCGSKGLTSPALFHYRAGMPRNRLGDLQVFILPSWSAKFYRVYRSSAFGRHFPERFIRAG